MTPLPYVSASAFSGPLMPCGVYDAVYVPQNFSLSFDLIATSTSAGWLNIINYNGIAAIQFFSVRQTPLEIDFYELEEV
jgi:hypothetical protein